MTSDRKQKQRCICIAPLDIASYYSGLREGLESLGHEVVFFCFEYSKFSRYRPRPQDTWLEKAAFILARFAAEGKSRSARLLASIGLLPLRVAAAIYATICCDLIIFGFAKTFLGRWDLPILAALGKQSLMVFNGSDTRPAWMSGIFVLGPGSPNIEAIHRETQRQIRTIRWIERFTTERLCHPLSAQLLRKPFINHLEVGHPFAGVSSQPTCALNDGRTSPVRAIHAPTRPLQKGSELFRTAIAELREEGFQIELIEYVDRPNSEVLEGIMGCDLILDETFSDIPIGGLGAEAAAAGKAFVVAGYGLGELDRFAAPCGVPLAFYVPPSDIKATIRANLDPKRRAQTATVAHTFVLAHWTPRLVAEKLLRLFEAGSSKQSRIDPSGLRYWQGWGAPECAILRAIRTLINQYGEASLGLSHNLTLIALVQNRLALLDRDEPC